MSRKNKSVDVLSAWGKGFDALKALCDAAQARGHNPNDLLRVIVHNEGVPEAMVDAAIAKLRLQAVESRPQDILIRDGIEWFTVPSLRTATKRGLRCYREMRDAGGYDKVWYPADQDDLWATEETAEPITELGIFRPDAHFRRDVSRMGVNDFLQERGVVDAFSSNLLDFGAATTTRYIQRRFPIVARGSVVFFEAPRVLCLSVSNGLRTLSTVSLDRVWSESCSLLVRRAPSAATT